MFLDWEIKSESLKKPPPTYTQKICQLHTTGPSVTTRAGIEKSAKHNTTFMPLNAAVTDKNISAKRTPSIDNRALSEAIWFYYRQTDTDLTFTLTHDYLHVTFTPQVKTESKF